MALAADLSQNISETEVAPDALVQKCSVFFTHAHGRIYRPSHLSCKFYFLASAIYQIQFLLRVKCLP